MRMLHTADWHLGRYFHRTSLLDQQAHVLEQVVDIAKQAKVDVVVVAGDIYDRRIPPTDAVQLLDHVIAELVIDAQIPVIVISGNHDSSERLAFGSRLFSQQKLFLRGSLEDMDRAIVLEDEHGEVSFFALPFVDPVETYRHLGARPINHRSAMKLALDQLRRRASTTQRSVLIAHTEVEGGRLSESDRLLIHGGDDRIHPSWFSHFNYVALGHLHHAQTLGDRVRYAGSIYPYSFSEADDEKSVSVVELNRRGEVSIESVPLVPKRHVRVEEGYFEDLLADASSVDSHDDFVKIVLWDKKPIVEAVSRLRQVYKNVLEVSRFEQPAPAPVARAVSQDSVAPRSDAQVFADFFADVTGERPQDDLMRRFCCIIEGLNSRQSE